MSKVIGIDLGSTNSAVALIEGGKATTIANSEGSRTTPSVILVKDGDRKVGMSAKRQMVVNPKETVNIIKRFMGATYDESKSAIEHVQYEVVKNDNGMPRVVIEGKEYSPEELSAMIITKMKKTAEDYIGEEVKDAVITVPAYFSDAARSATKTAGELAGLNVLRVVAEPTAALLASNINMEKEAKYLVADIGGATTDFSVAEIADNTVEIAATNGDVYLGGADFDKAIADYIVEEFKNENGIDLKENAQAYSRIIEAAENAKIELSNTMSTTINLPYITIKADSTPIHLEQTITRAKFEQLINPFIVKLKTCIDKSMTDASVSGDELEGVILVGGSCRIPIIKETIQKTANAKLIESANLDLAVAEGAAVQGGIINKEYDTDLLLIDVTPLAYGIETMGGVMTTIVDANTTIPCKREQTFSTAMDNQSEVAIRVLQGNRPMANQNKEIGLFKLDGILPARRGVPQILVTFDIDANGILKVTAVDKGTNKEQHITIESKGGLTQEEVDRMKKEAEEYAESDKKLKEEAETINKGDSIVFTQESLLEDMKDKLEEGDVSLIQESIDKMKEAVKDRNCEKINSLEEEINKKWNEISSKIYQKEQQEEASKQENTSKNKDDDDIQDVKFEEVN